MTFADLAADTAVKAEGAGCFRIDLPDHWDYMLPSGGVLMTCALRAAEAAIGDPAFRLASSTTIFASPMHPGPLLAEVHVIRRGASAVQTRVMLRHLQEKDGEPGLELLATFLRHRKGPDVLGVPFPPVKSVADALPTDDGAPKSPHTRWRFYQQLECRLADGGPFWEPSFEAGPAFYARWLRYRVPQRDAEGHFDRLALPPLIDTMPTALHRAIGPSPYRFHAPSLDLTIYTIDDTRREWVLVAVTVRRANGGWGVADAEVWDDEGRFIAYGTQAMYLHTLSGEPPTVDASDRFRR